MQEIMQISAAIIFLSMLFLAVTELEVSFKSILSLFESVLVVSICAGLLVGTIFLAATI